MENRIYLIKSIKYKIFIQKAQHLRPKSVAYITAETNAPRQCR